MKTLLLVALIATPALAGELPLKAVYGTPEACRFYAEGGRDAVILTESEQELPVVMLTRNELWLSEAVCTHDSNAYGPVDFSCEGDGQDLTATITPKDDYLLWQDEDGTLELRPCPTDENATM